MNLSGPYLSALMQYRKGQYQFALDRLSRVSPKNRQEEYDCIRLCMYCLVHLNRFKEAIVWAKKTVDLYPGRQETWHNYGACLIRAGRIDEGISALRQARKKPGGENNPGIFDGLAHAQGVKGNHGLVRLHGHRSLELKSNSVETRELLQREDSQRSMNVVSFSLFGNRPKYIEGAILNIEAAKQHYPGWQCRFYCAEDTARLCADRIVAAGGEVVIKGAATDLRRALCWRFEVLDDLRVDRYLIRDCDAVIGKRESTFVSDWIRSGKAFHVIRDAPTHSELILAGLWGGTAGVVPGVGQALHEFLKRDIVVNTHFDQLFLREILWPYIKANHIAHDSFFGFMTDGSDVEPVQNPDLRVGRDLCCATLQTSLTDPDLRRRYWRISDGDQQVCEYPLVFDGKCWASEEIPNTYWENIKKGVLSVEVYEKRLRRVNS